MRFTVARDAFAEAVAWVARALPSLPVIPVLAGLLLQADEDRLTLACFDYEVSARMTVPAEVAEPGTALVPGRLLVEITRSLPALPVQWWDDPDGVSMTCGEASFTLVPLPRGEYPDLPDVPHVAGTVDGGRLRHRDRPGHPGGEPGRHAAHADRGEPGAGRRDDDARRHRPLPAGGARARLAARPASTGRTRS